MPEISVIIPVYKAEASLDRCVGSILAQTYQNFDVILVDDGSPDNCPAMCDAYAAKDSRIHVIHQPNAGVSVARNVGMEWSLANSGSNWIAFVDSDDWVHKKYLERQLDVANEQKTKLTICDMQSVDQYCEDSDIHPTDPVVLGREDVFIRYIEKSMSVWGKLIHKSLIGDVRFPPGKRYEDAAVGYRLMLASEKTAVIADKLYYYYFNEDSFTRVAWNESRLDCFEIHEQRLNYLRQHGYTRCYPYEIKVYIDRITENLRYLSELVDQDDKYEKFFCQLREKLRWAVREGRALGIVRFRKENLMAYAYASRCDAVWKISRAAQRVWHKLRKN